MTVAVDNISGDITIRMDKKPDSQDGLKLIEDIKAHGFGWKGYSENARWQGKNACVSAFEDKAFCARIKLACKNLSFFGIDGKHLGTDRIAFIQSASSYDPTTLDDDFSSMGSSSIAPVTPNGTPQKRPRDNDKD